MSDFYDQATGKKSLATDDLAFVKKGMTAQELFNSGGSSFEPTQAQLDAMNSGITSEKVAQINTNKNNISAEQAKTTGMSEGGSNYITVGGIRVYVSATAPTGARTGDLWIGG